MKLLDVYGGKNDVLERKTSQSVYIQYLTRGKNYHLPATRPDSLTEGVPQQVPQRQQADRKTNAAKQRRVRSSAKPSSLCYVTGRGRGGAAGGARECGRREFVRSMDPEVH
ncbi:hypothetical protein E2C01_032527 [Portunus trituberculatus]|uniref:Uncharacterized protein n=1 Tax=Portunus trituberculatus TaxID=210409 RepID=A0A5B7F162_PORTR|nr:hypothetical protein [Portunus trituberculatus]